jgi:hypothetical protein
MAGLAMRFVGYSQANSARFIHTQGAERFLR